MLGENIPSVQQKRSEMTPRERVFDTFERVAVYAIGCTALFMILNALAKYLLEHHGYAVATITIIILCFMYTIFLFAFGAHMVFIYNKGASTGDEKEDEESTGSEEETVQTLTGDGSND
jgi:hypothetical protein